jgi:hypothetical protein
MCAPSRFCRNSFDEYFMFDSTKTDYIQQGWIQDFEKGVKLWTV